MQAHIHIVVYKNTKKKYIAKDTWTFKYRILIWQTLHQNTLNHCILAVVPLSKKMHLYSFFTHLADGPNFDNTSMASLTELVVMSLPSRASSSAKLSFSCRTTVDIVGLWVATSDMQSIAVSTTFHMELMSYESLSRASATKLILPEATFCFTRWMMWPLPGSIGASPVAISSRTTPKL